MPGLRANGLHFGPAANSNVYVAPMMALSLDFFTAHSESTWRIHPDKRGPAE